MKPDRLATVLIVALVCSTFGAVLMTYQYLRAEKTLRTLQSHVAQINRHQLAMQAIALDLNEYARRNRDIEPLLERLNMRPRNSTNAAAAPKP
jgi:hypothetical protein